MVGVRKHVKLYDATRDRIDLSTGYCTECLYGRGTSHIVCVITEEFIGRVCSSCGVKDSQYLSQIRNAAGLLLDMGFRLQRILLEIYPSAVEGDVVWNFQFSFQRTYVDEMFASLPEEFSKVYSGGRVTGLGYCCVQSIAKVFTEEFMNSLVHTATKPFGDQRDVLLAENWKYPDGVLTQWCKEMILNGNTAIWRLAGYFE